MRYLIVDGMLSRTGVRDAVDGGYVVLAELGVSPSVVEMIANWLSGTRQHSTDSLPI